MKKIVIMLSCIALSVTMVLGAAACNKGGENAMPSNYTRPENPTIDNSFEANSNILVAYFSRTNTTEGVAETIAEYTGADLFEIERREPYPDEYTPTTEVAEEEKNENARPELAAYLPDEVMAQYDTIILGFPIWWYTAPMPVLSFLNYYDLSGKTIYTFCTSASSSISASTIDIRDNAHDATVIEGRRFSNGNDGNIESWLQSLDLSSSS